MTDGSYDFLFSGATAAPLRFTLADLSGTLGEPLETSILRYCRLVGGPLAKGPVQSPESTADLLEYVASTWSEAAFANTSEDNLATLNQLTEACTPQELLLLLAEQIRTIARNPVPDYKELPMLEWESRSEFPKIHAFARGWFSDPDYSTTQECLTAGILSEHPFCCHIELPPLISQTRMALTLFPSEEASVENLGRWLPLRMPPYGMPSFRSWLEQIDREGYEHMTVHHDEEQEE